MNNFNPDKFLEEVFRKELEKNGSEEKLRKYLEQNKEEGQQNLQKFGER